MKYIGPFFRMNSLCEDDICGQLFHLSKEAIKTITLNSKCGIVSSLRSSKKTHSTNDISIFNNFSPLLCLYKKSSPVFIHNKSSYGFDESTFRKTINPTTNALMTLSLLELSSYYSNYRIVSKDVNSLEKPYYILCQKQLDFYSNNLRNSEGVFIEKKNISDNNSKGFNLIDNDKDFKFSSQAFMMDAYYLYSINLHDDKDNEDYKDFSLQILDMFLGYQNELYNLSFDEGLKILLALNILYDYEPIDKCKSLIIDLSDYLITKYHEKDYYVSSLDNCCLLAINLSESFKHTNILSFKETAAEIVNKLEGLYDQNKGIFIKLSDKKEIKYSSLEICFYFLVMLLYPNSSQDTITYKNMISSLYRKFFINSGIVASFPEAPTLDEIERYRKLSLHSSDMLDESFFRMPNAPSPESNGIAPIFLKSITYSRKKESFSTPKPSFDSNKNMMIYFIFIHYLKKPFINKMNFESNFSSESSDDTTEKPDLPKDNEK